MYRSSANRLFASIVSVAVVLLLVSSGALLGAQQPAPGAKVVKPTTVQAVRVGVSPPMRTMKTVKPVDTSGKVQRAIPNPRLPNRGTPNAPRGHDPRVQTTMGKGAIPAPLTSFDGVGDADFVQPADTTMDVSPDQILQWVNLSWAVYDKDGNNLGGPFEGTSFWADLGGVCANNNGGDILVRWDQFAGQWWVSQLAYPGGADGFHQCIAVSQTSDALGSYYQYDFLYSATDLNDYPKVGMWPVPGAATGTSVINDGYYVSVNNFVNDQFFGSTKIMAFDRQAQLSGNPGVMQIYDVGEINANLGIMLPADLRGTSLPPNGSLESYISFGHPDLDGSPGPVLHIFQTYTDFTNPANSFLQQLPDIAVDDFDWLSVNAGAPQVGGGTLEVLNDRPMYRADYRVFADHDSLLMMHDVNVGPTTPVSGERWYEVRGVAAGTPTVYQSGTYGPDDNTWRWMGSIAQDTSGNISMGFTASSDGTGIVPDPSVHYTGRLVGDPLGTMTAGEDTYIDSDQPFSGFRWGDYSTVVVDPVDQCTFWYTTMYGAGDWATRIGSFKFPSCTNGPSGTLTGTVTDGANPLSGVKVTAGSASTNTDASGAYSFTLPVGTYDMVASKYGYLPGTANGVSVAQDTETVQNFTLSAAPSVNINGVVKDGSGGDWPLYAKVVIKASGAPTFTLYTDPVTGYYAQTLVSGIPYTFTVNAITPGYTTGGGVVPLIVAGQTPNGVVVNWSLIADLQSCNAPGYGYPAGTLFEPFSTGGLPAGWSQDNFSGAGTWRFPPTSAGDGCANSGGNQTGGSGGFAILDSDCDGLVQDDVALVTPSVDFSSTASPILSFNSDYKDLESVADVDVSTDGGADWTNVWERAGADDRGPTTNVIDLSKLAGGQPDVRARFHFQGFWAWWWSVDNVLMGNPEAACSPQPGGLVVGNVFSSNTGNGLNGATVANLTAGTSVKTFGTPDDPSQPDGLYIMFSESGSTDLQASLNLYGTDEHTKIVIPNSTVRQDFVLASGNVTAAPSAVNSMVNPGGTDNQTLTLTNSGGAAANFQIIEINAPLITNNTAGFASQSLRSQALARLKKGSGGRPDLARNAKGLGPLPNVPRNARPMAAGDVVASYPTGLAGGWGVLSSGSSFWLSNIAGLGGDEHDWEYSSSDGTQTGKNIDNTSWVGSGGFTADGAFDTLTGMMWQVNVGGDNCIYELDPAAAVPTGNKICGSPWTGTSQRGLAYDVVNDAFFIGGWNEGIVYHIDHSGNVMDSANVGLPISGLAYAPSSGHLLVMSNTDSTDITVLDALNNYAVIGSYSVNNGGSPAFGAFEQAGLEFDCLGNLWAVNQISQIVYNVDSGETVGCSVDIPWLTENPTSGTLSPAALTRGASSSLPVTLTFDAGTLMPGLRQAQLQVKTDTPVAVAPVAVTLTVRFLDVPDDNQFQAYIYGAAGAGIMFGGPPNCPAGVLDFCPNNVVTRADMAGYIFRAVHGPTTPPPVYLNEYADVTFNQYNSFYIQGITDDGITVGCGNGDYCPDAPNTRAQMSVFIWKGQHGSAAPPACTDGTAVFADVPCGSFAADYIYGLFGEGVTAGCGGGNFCPNANITNGQMAVFLVKGFNIPHL